MTDSRDGLPATSAIVALIPVISAAERGKPATEHAEGYLKGLTDGLLWAAGHRAAYPVLVLLADATEHYRNLALTSDNATDRRMYAAVHASVQQAYQQARDREPALGGAG